ncbi:MAG: hypothetical protein LQ350_002591 [Teloschistes chrysophthalmus]|nr:MAG: hypothetical protein LQ350_002591 [Niorma chrysophthalma]
MSFLNSVLSTIGKDGQPMPLSQTQPQPSPRPLICTSNANPRPKTAVPLPNMSSATKKRKAEDLLPDPKAKSLKDEQGRRHVVMEKITRPGVKEPTRPSICTSKSALTVPYRGTARPSPTSASPDTPTGETSKTAPKKGTFAEIMARANKTAVGAIKHKPKETISAKKQILMTKKGILPKDAKTNGHDRKDSRSGRDSNSPKPRTPTSKSPGLPSKKPQPSYKGTAALKPQPTYRGTIRPGDSAKRKDVEKNRSRSTSTNPPRRPQRYDSEEEDEDDIIDDEEEDEGDYPDGSSDDMEAGFDDVEEEESAAVKAAKLEDAEELRLENQHKKEKEDRRKMLAAMAAKAAKPRY